MPIYTGSCYQGPNAGQMLSHNEMTKRYYDVDPESNKPILIGEYRFDGYDIWKWTPNDGEGEPRNTEAV